MLSLPHLLLHLCFLFFLSHLLFIDSIVCVERSIAVGRCQFLLLAFSKVHLKRISMIVKRYFVKSIKFWRIYNDSCDISTRNIIIDWHWYLRDAKISSVIDSNRLGFETFFHIESVRWATIRNYNYKKIKSRNYNYKKIKSYLLAFLSFVLMKIKIFKVEHKLCKSRCVSLCVAAPLLF